MTLLKSNQCDYSGVSIYLIPFLLYYLIYLYALISSYELIDISEYILNVNFSISKKDRS